MDGCGGTETGDGGTIVSPGYPHSFPKDVECVWLIRVENSKHIYIRILDLQLYGSIGNKLYICISSVFFKSKFYFLN